MNTFRMALWMHVLGLRMYHLLVYVASIWNERAKLFTNGRSNTFSYLAKAIPAQQKTIWYHCASLGEYEQAKPIIEALVQKHPHLLPVVSFFSPSGYEVVSKRKDAPVCFYLPAATPKNANMLLNVLNAEMIFFVKYEFWWSYFIEAHKRKIPLYLVCSVFRKNQYFFKWYGQTYLKMLQLFDWIFTQNNESVGLLKSKQIEHCSYSGDTRYDRVMKIASSPKEIPEIKLFKQNSPLIVAGSSYTTEDNLIKEALLKNSELKAVIAPHHIDEKRIGEIVATFAAFKPCRYTHHQVDENSRVLILDTIGLLSSAYAYADAALVGGGFGHKGLHNIIEPCVFGIPVFFGPNHHRFHEARYLIDMGCAFEINHDDDFVPKLQSTFQPENRTAIKNICKRVFENNAGVTPSILKAIDELRNKF